MQQQQPWDLTIVGTHVDRAKGCTEIALRATSSLRLQAPTLQDSETAAGIGAAARIFLQRLLTVMPRPISFESFMRHLEVEFHESPTDMPLSTYPPGSYSWTAWNPVRISIYPTRFVWELQLVDIGAEPGVATPAAAEPTIKLVTVQPDLPPATDELVPPFPDELNLDELATNEIVESGLTLLPGHRQRQRQKIRYARLRVVKEKLKLARLRREYLERYGRLNGSDAHSVVSSSSSDRFSLEDSDAEETAGAVAPPADAAE